LEYKFSQNNETVLGVLKHVQDDSKNDLLVEILMLFEATTTEISKEKKYYFQLIYPVYHYYQNNILLVLYTEADFIKF
jgi:hypothetical protein